MNLERDPVNHPIKAGLAAALALSAAALAETNRPAEADLYLHLKNAFKNPAGPSNLPRVLLIGDSISIGYTVPVRKELEGRAQVFRPPVNCQFTGYGLAHVKEWIGTNHWDVIHFNWGIWDTHMLDAKGNLVRNADEINTQGLLHIRYTPEEYGSNLAKIVTILHGTGAKLIFATTTPVMSRKGDRFEAIPRLNTVAVKLMAERGIPVNDLYGFVLPQAKEWQQADKVHFNDAGNARLGQKVGDVIRQALPPESGPGKAPAAPAPHP